MFSKSIMTSLRWIRCIVISVMLIYLNIVLSNLISWRQSIYADKYNNGSSLTPLHDSLFVDWIQGHMIPKENIFTIRELVDVFSYTWIAITIICWCCIGKIQHVANVIAAELILVPTFAFAQLMTIVPDSTPNCLEEYNIPRGADTSWIWWRYPTRSCGNMLWSSDLAQLLIFVYLMDQTITFKCCNCLVTIISHIWVLITAALIFTSKYQYSVDVISTIIIVKLIMSHPTLHKFAKRCFIKDSDYFARVPVQELPETSI